MALARPLVVVADDFGIGPETSRGILDAALAGRLSATVLLVNSPFAEAAVSRWQRVGRPVEVGWHPNLTLDRPILPAKQVRSLVDASGRFWTLGRFLMRAVLGRIRAAEVAAELRAQYERFCALLGRAPRLVNSHQHVALFGPVGPMLLDILDRYPAKPFFRRLGESWSTLWRVPGARIKRLVLTQRSRRLARLARERGYIGCDVLAGVANPRCVHDPHFYGRWLANTKGRSVELMCHPGYFDATLAGRDCLPGAAVERRVRELGLLTSDTFETAVRDGGFRIVAPDELRGPLRLAA